MEKFKGTPGPWEAKYNGHYMDIRTKGDCLSFASTHMNSYMNIDANVMDANAKLIAAAPELLEALIDILVFCRSHGMENGFTEQSTKAINKALGIPTNSTDPLTQSRIMKATEGLNLEEQ